MPEPDKKAAQPKLATSEAIPKAVEFLILFLIRWACFGLAGAFGFLSLAAALCCWAAWIAGLLILFTGLMIACGAAIRPQGEFRFDRVGPSIIVPDSSS